MKISRRCVITGRVQGVFFRQGTLEKANALGITGWVRNLSSGEVECVICGEEKAIEAMIAWLHQGPNAARVEQVDINEERASEYADFRIFRS